MARQGIAVAVGRVYSWGMASGKKRNLSDAERARRSYSLSLARRVLSSVRPPWSSVAGRGLQWLYPWSSDDYPGVVQGALELLGGRVTWAAVKHWRAGRDRFPAWARTIMADQIEGRCRAGLQIVEELRAVKDKPKVAVGFRIVSEGRNRANRVGRTKVGLQELSGKPDAASEAQS